MKNQNQSEFNPAQARIAGFRSNMRKVLIGVFVFSLYGTGFLNVMIHPQYGHRFSAGSVLKAFFFSRSTLLIFPLLSAGLSLLAVLSIHRTWEESLRDDKLNRGFLHSKKATPYGDAHFEEPHEYLDAAQIRPVEACKGKILGQLDKEGRECVDFNPYEGRINSHMIAIGRSGGGKTFTFVKSFMLQAQKEKHSLFIADPKGDLYREMSGFFRDNGYVVRKLDLKNLEKSDGWHCLGSLHGTNLITNTQIFSSTVMANISEHDDVYSRAGGSLLSALILRVLQGEDYPQERKNIKTVHELLQNPGGIEFLDSLLSAENVTASEMACSRFYMDFKRASGNLAGNIITHLATGIQLFNNSLLSEILSTDEMDLALPGQVPCIYFLNFPDTNDTYRFVVSLFFSMAFIALVDYADIHTKNGKLPVAVDFLLDEFPALGVIPDWDRKIATVRSRDINCVMIVQDIPQLKKRYLESWMTILNNCGCLLTLGINEPKETATWLSERIGEASIEVVSESETVIAGTAKSFMSKQSVGIGKRQFLSPAELCELSRDGSIVIFTDHKPVYVNKFPYTLFPDADKLYDTLPEDLTDFTDKKASALLRAAERAYQEEFWLTHARHPDMNYKDVSDALYTDPPQSPVSMLLDMVREDLTHIFQLLCNAGKWIQTSLFHRSAEDEMESEDAHDDADFIAEDKSLHTKTATKGAFRDFFSEYSKGHAFDFFSQNDSITTDNSFAHKDQNSCTAAEKLGMSERIRSPIDQRNAEAEFKSISKNPLRALNTGLAFNPSKRESGHKKEMEASQVGDPNIKSSKRLGMLPYKKNERD